MNKAAFAFVLLAALPACGRKKPPKSQLDGDGFGAMTGPGGAPQDSLDKTAIPPGISWMCFRDLNLPDFSYCARSLESCDELRNTLISQDQEAGKTSNLTNCGSQGSALCHTYRRYKDGTKGWSCSMDEKDCEGSRRYYKKKADYGEVSVCSSVSE